MRSRQRLAFRSLALLSACGAIALTSCGGEDAFGKRYYVSGTVTYNGTPLEKGKISFIPEDPKGVGASGIIENGSQTPLTRGGQPDPAAGEAQHAALAGRDANRHAHAAVSP